MPEKAMLGVYLVLSSTLFLSIGVILLASKLRRLEHRVAEMSMFLELFTKATVGHINRIDKALEKEKQDA